MVVDLVGGDDLAVDGGSDGGDYAGVGSGSQREEGACEKGYGGAGTWFGREWFCSWGLMYQSGWKNEGESGVMCRLFVGVLQAGF